MIKYYTKPATFITRKITPYQYPRPRERGRERERRNKVKIRLARGCAIMNAITASLSKQISV